MTQFLFIFWFPRAGVVTHSGRAGVQSFFWFPRCPTGFFLVLIDTTNSMAAEINGVIRALKKFITEIEPSQAPLIVLVEFKDNVRFLAATRDLEVLLKTVAPAPKPQWKP
jgi:hypothetical protein